MIVTAAGVDSWSLCWYVDPHGAAGRRLGELATVPSAGGSMLLPRPVADHRVGWVPASGLMFADGHPELGELCLADSLLWRGLEVYDAVAAAGVPVSSRERAFWHSGSSSEGWAGVRRCDATVNFATASRAEGLATLAGIAACVRDSPGHAQIRFGLDRAVETVYLHGYAGKRVLGRWYDKGLESGLASRGRLIRAEDQRRWGKGDRRDFDELGPERLRAAFRRRFYPLWKATKGVTVAGPVVLAEKLVEAVAEGRIGAGEAEALCGHLIMQSVGGRRGAGVSRATMYRREGRARELGLAIADGVLEEVEVDVGAVLEAALETDAWERRG